MRRLSAILLGLLIAASALGSNSLPLSPPPFQGHIGKSYQQSTPDWPEPVKPAEDAPNIVLILLDDVGFGAAGTFGGPASTPTLDALSANGIRYNNFHTTSLCSPTRAALLTGRNPHRVGFGTVTEIGSGFPGYNGIWKKSAASVAEVLRQHGYSTAAFGKWHNTPAWEMGPTGPFDRWPTGLGFEYFYGFMSGATNQWEPSLFRNTIPVEAPAKPDQGYHLTTDLTNDAINWVHTHQSLAPERPYFLYFATGGTHSPHHVPDEWIEKYRGRFDQGWDALRKETFERQKKLGVIPPDTVLTARPPELPAWDSFSPDQQKMLARQMEVYSAFLAHTDHEIARLVETVQADKNTLVIYIVGDNGGAGNGYPEGEDNIAEVVPEERLNHMDELGGVLHNNDYSTMWAWATSTPFQWMKGVASHFGGTRNPLVISWPAEIKNPGRLATQFANVTDIVPTIYQVAHIPVPTSVNGVKQLSLDGVSLANTFYGRKPTTSHRTQYFEQWGNRAIYKDGWVAAAFHASPWDKNPKRDFSKDRWELYNVDKDFSQSNDVSEKFPEKLKELQTAFDKQAMKNSVYPLVNSYGMTTGHTPPWYPADRTSFIYYPGMPRIPIWSAPNFLNPHRIKINALIPKQGAEGVLFSYGGRYGGFVLYAKNNKLFYENNFQGKHLDSIVSNTTLPDGKVELIFEYSFAGEKNSGTGSLYINGNLVGNSPIPHMGTAFYYDGISIGKELGSSVSTAYQAPYLFNGKLINITVNLLATPD